MRVFPRTFGVQTATQVIGIDGEVQSAKLRINVARQMRSYPDATYAITIKRADGETYPAAIGLTPDSGGWVEYVLTTEDLALPGALQAEAQMRRNGEVVIKSTIWPFSVARSLAYTQPNPPPLIPHWADEVLSKSDAVLDAIQAWEDAGGSNGGLSITDISVNAEGRLVFTLSDGTTMTTGTLFEPIPNDEIDQITTEGQ